MFLNHTIVVDDFYPNAQAVRAMLYSMPREENSKGNYAGFMTQQAFMTDQHYHILEHILGEPVVATTELCGKIRFTFEHHTAKQHIHFDPGVAGIWAGVCYLQTPDYYPLDNRMGTSFWKHKRTNLTHVPLTQQGIEQHGWYNSQDLVTLLETEGMQEDLWECTLHVPYKFNRLVLFRPWMFHSPGESFGDHVSNCRIVQTFFLSQK